MTGGSAHEFRNALAVIEFGLNLTERDQGDLKKLRFCLVAAHEGVGRGLNLTSRPLAFVKQRELVGVVSEVAVGTTFDLLFRALENQNPVGGLSAQIGRCTNGGRTAEQKRRPAERMPLPTSRTRTIQ